MNHFEILFRDNFTEGNFTGIHIQYFSMYQYDYYWVLSSQKGKPINYFRKIWNWRHPKQSILRQSEHGAFSVIPNNVQCVIFSEGKAYQRHNIMDHSHWKLNVFLSSLQHETCVKLSKWNPSIGVDSRELHPAH